MIKNNDLHNKRKKLNNICLSILAATLLIVCSIICSCKGNTRENNSGTIQDLRGYSFTIDNPIKKILSTHNPSLNHLIALGSGTSKYICGFGRKDIADNLYKKILPDWNDIISVGSDISPLNKEAVIQLNPDLIVIPEFNWESREKDFEGTNIRTFVCFSKEESFDSIINSLETLAKLVGEDGRAQIISDKFNSIIKDVTSSIQKSENNPDVAFMGPYKYSLTTSNMIQNKIIKCAGANDLADKRNWKGLFETIDAETIINLNPDYIFIPSYANYDIKDIANDDKLANVKAVKNREIYKFPSKLEPWDYPTCCTCLGLSWMTNKLHPELYPIEKAQKNISEIYKLLYNHDFTIEEIGID